MEFLSGGSLLGYLKNETEQGVLRRKKKRLAVNTGDPPAKLTTRDVYQFCIDVARGMEYISDHEVSIIRIIIRSISYR